MVLSLKKVKKVLCFLTVKLALPKYFEVRRPVYNNWDPTRVGSTRLVQEKGPLNLTV